MGRFVYESSLDHLLSFGVVRKEGRICIDFQNTINKIIVINFVVLRYEGLQIVS